MSTLADTPAPTRNDGPQLTRAYLIRSVLLGLIAVGWGAVLRPLPCLSPRGLSVIAVMLLSGASFISGVTRLLSRGNPRSVRLLGVVALVLAIVAFALAIGAGRTLADCPQT